MRKSLVPRKSAGRATQQYMLNLCVLLKVRCRIPRLGGLNLACEFRSTTRIWRRGCWSPTPHRSRPRHRNHGPIGLSSRQCIHWSHEGFRRHADELCDFIAESALIMLGCAHRQGPSAARESRRPRPCHRWPPPTHVHPGIPKATRPPSPVHGWLPGPGTRSPNHSTFHLGKMVRVISRHNGADDASLLNRGGYTTLRK